MLCLHLAHGPHEELTSTRCWALNRHSSQITREKKKSSANISGKQTLQNDEKENWPQLCPLIQRLKPMHGDAIGAKMAAFEEVAQKVNFPTHHSKQNRNLPKQQQCTPTTSLKQRKEDRPRTQTIKTRKKRQHPTPLAKEESVLQKNKPKNKHTFFTADTKASN